ncbi:MAG: restriction endonuclease [Planctomycetes bacterium]|nr:restriction endonuclease [Planctomycetota bacterium]
MKSKNKEGAQFVRYFGPLLDALRELGGSATPTEASTKIAESLKISKAQQDELLESGSPRFHNQVQFSRFYLVREGLIDGSKRGIWALTPEGWKTNLDYQKSREIFLKWVDIFAKARKQDNANKHQDVDDEDIDDAIERVPFGHRSRLLEIIKELSPAGFERLCQRLLRESGFTQVTVTGRSGDGGIDGIGILEVNPFVSFRVLFQCKKYSGSVGASHVRDFRGSMLGRADKGIIITTGSFTQDAQREATRDGAPPLELVHGDKLVDMFESLELGLIPRKSYDIDESFFASFKESK